MSRPGDRLRACAAWLFEPDDMARLVDPVIADLQMEYAAASRAGRIWRRRWIRLVGYAAFFWVTTRTLRAFLLLTLGFGLLFEAPYHARMTATRAVYLLPQATAVAIPIAYACVVAWTARRIRSARHVALVLAFSLACSAGVLVLVGWGMPHAIQKFQASVSAELGIASPRRPLAVGANELTLGELRQQSQLATAGSTGRSARQLVFAYDFRWALSFASFALAALMLALFAGSNARTAEVITSVPVVIVGYYVLLWIGRFNTISGYWMPVYLGAWLGNLVTIAAAGTIALLNARRRSAIQCR